METQNFKTIDLSYLETTCMGNDMLKIQIITMFLDKTKDRLLGLKASISEKDWNNVYAAAHKIKSSFNTIGAKKGGEILENIETIAKGDDHDKLSELNKNFEELNSLNSQCYNELTLVLNQIK